MTDKQLQKKREKRKAGRQAKRGETASAKYRAARQTNDALWMQALGYLLAAPPPRLGLPTVSVNA